MTSEVIQRTAKLARNDEDDQESPYGNNERAAKAKRHDIEVPMAEVDIKLAEKLDNILKISDTRKPRFFMNRPKAINKSSDNEVSKISADANDKLNTLKHKNFSKEQLRQRLSEKYDTLVPELDPKRPTVKLVKILSATESLELGKEQARKQLEHQLELNSVSGNQLAKKNGIGSFKFQDGYELPAKCFFPGKKSLSSIKHKSVSFASDGRANGVMATVKYFKPDENEAMSSEDDSDDDDKDDDDDDDDDDDESDDVDEDEDDDETDGDESYHLLGEKGRR